MDVPKVNGPVRPVTEAEEEAKNFQNPNDSKKRKRKKVNGKENKFKVAFTNRRVTRLMSRSANNELSKAELSGLSEDEKLLLTSWGLPVSVIAKYKSKGITSLFPWQLECLGNAKVLEGRNLLYSAPTSAGKTLVADILMAKRVLELGKKAIMILPFVSVCREKMFSLQEIYGDAGVRAEGFMGSQGPVGGFKSVDIAICTIEKANGLINKMLEENSLSELGTIVVDELHLISDPHRGYLLELLLTKIKFMLSKQRLADMSMSSEDDSKESKKLNIQIIGMSATLPNLELLSTWIDAELVVTDYRPVPLVERLIFGDKIYDQLLQPIRDVQITSLPIQIQGDDNKIVYLSLETVLGGHSVLIFCPTKNKCETLARQIAQEFWRIGNPLNDAYPEIGESLRKQLNTAKITDVLSQLKECPGGMDDVLKKTVSFAVAFHHAGLTYDERDIIESSFKRGVLRVIVATSTLSAGVNLPARRVIVSTPLFNGGQLDVLTYRQMCGRAGRKGVDTEGKIERDAEGESILICTDTTKDKGAQLVQAALPCVKSALLGNPGTLSSSMKRALLEVVASGIATLPSEVEKYAKYTLLSRSIDLGLYDKNDLPTLQQNKDQIVDECLKFLVDKDFIRLQRYETEGKSDEYMATQLGSACLASSLGPDEGITVYKELQKARRCFVLESELHVVYQVTPIYLSDQLRDIPWLNFFNIFGELNPEDRLVADLVGVEEDFIMRAMIGSVAKNDKSKDKFMIHQRFFAALALNDLVNETPISAVERKYTLNKGVIQSLQQAASTFAGMVTAFCSRLGWSNIELLLNQFQDRLQFGVQRELCGLVRLTTMNGQRARILYDNGIKTVAELAAADPAHVESILHRAVPFLSTVHGEGQTSQIQRNVWMLGKGEGLSEGEAAQKIVEEARQFIQMELGLAGDLEFICTPKPDGPQTSSSQKSTAMIPSKVDLPDESESSDDSTDQVDPLEKEDDIKLLHNDLIKTEKTPKPEVEKTILTEKSISAKNQQPVLEKVKNQNISYDPVFDDSFVTGSQDLFADMEALLGQPKGVQFQGNNGNQPSDCNFGDQEEPMDVSGDMKMLVKELMESSMEFSDKEQAKTPKHKHRRKTIDDGIIKHSTPVLDSCVSSFKKRLSAITPGPIVSNEGHGQTPEINGEYRSNNVVDLNGSWEINEELLAEFDKSFDSVASRMEISLNISDGMDKKEDIKIPFNSVCETGKILKPEITYLDVKDDELFPKLNDSDAAAMQAMLDDSKAFESEDLFAEFEKSKASTPSPPAVIINNIRNRLSENGVPVGPKTIDFTSKKAQDVECESSMESETNIFENSSEFETSNSLTSGQSSARNSCPHEPILTAIIDERTIKVMKVLAPEFIPHDMFDASKPVGIGMKLMPSKRSSSARCGGIGSRIVSPKTIGRIVGEEDREHSITLYNGGNTIWVFQWKHSESQMIRNGRMHPFLNIQGKLGDLFKRLKDSGTAIVLFDSKEKLKKLLNYFGKDLITKFPNSNRIWDPKIAHWILQFNDDNCRVSSNEVVAMNLDTGKKQVTCLEWGREIMDPFIAYHVIESLRKKLEGNKLWEHFTDIEMPSMMPIMLMEMNGFGLDSNELGRMQKVLQFKAALLEIRAYQLAGRQFNLSSPQAIRQILFKEIGLQQPSNLKSTGTGKEVLGQLDHELPRIIIEWRKITCALTKVVNPFQQDKNLETRRIHGNYSHYTVTGRVVMFEPSLQCVPRDFDLDMDYSAEDIQDIKENCRIKFGSKIAILLNQIDRGISASQEQKNAGVSLISMRNVFVPCSNEFIILAADYSQLELRILAHLSKDKKLLTALSLEDGDVFISIASQWKKLPAEQITSRMRQEAKGIVYGVIYGMGAKTLSEQMDVNEKDAARFISEFKRTYPGVQTFLKNAVESCRKVGYIETISGRRRYLSHINSNDSTKRAQAERQAVNSQIQGSAADLVKKAMTNIHRHMSQTFPESCIPINWNQTSKSLHSTSFDASSIPKVIYFPVLNLHDELIFEVRKSHITLVAAEIRNQMESSLKLSVSLPVVIKVGSSWGSLSKLE